MSCSNCKKANSRCSQDSDVILPNSNFHVAVAVQHSTWVLYLELYDHQEDHIFLGDPFHSQPGGTSQVPLSGVTESLEHLGRARMWLTRFFGLEWLHVIRLLFLKPQVCPYAPKNTHIYIYEPFERFIFYNLTQTEGCQPSLVFPKKSFCTSLKFDKETFEIRWHLFFPNTIFSLKLA